MKSKPLDTSFKIPLLSPNKKCCLRFLKLQRLKDMLTLEEEFLKDINGTKVFQEKDIFLEKAINKLRGNFMMVATLQEVLDNKRAIISIAPSNSEWIVPISSIVNRKLLKPNSSVLISHKNFSIVGIIEEELNSTLLSMKLSKVTHETFADVGGLVKQIQEIKEVIELPFTHPEYFECMGIKPPKGVILYGPPGTGKTLLAKAVANSTSATFLHVIGSELVKKNLGEGPKLIRKVFKLAQDNAPSIIFVDEIDAIGNKRKENFSDGELEIQRTLLELLNQLDGFDEKKDIKVIMATNNIQSLDPALIRPGRIDFKIEVPKPDKEGKRKIFEIHTAKMTKMEDINIDEVLQDDDLSGADIKTICIEAGLRALRDKRFQVNNQDFLFARESVIKKKIF